MDHEDKPQRLAEQSRALVYAGLVGTIQAIGRRHGYAIAVHGSMATDLDLIAVPWTEEAVDVDVMVDDLCERLGGYLPLRMDGGRFTEKPHGRHAYSIHWMPSGSTQGLPGPLWKAVNANHVYVDLSVMPKANAGAIDPQTGEKPSCTPEQPESPPSSSSDSSAVSP